MGIFQTQDKQIDEYTEQTIAHGEATNTGNYRRANMCYSRIVEALKALDDEGARTALSRLLNHPNASVRCWAATHLLPHKEELAKLALKKIVEENSGWIGFDAKMVLQEWEKGTLKIP